MSHQIRTALNGVMGMAQMLMLPEVSDVDRLHYARVILNSGQSLLALLGDLQQSSAVDKKSETSSPITTLNPKHVLQKIENVFAQRLKDKRMRATFLWDGSVDTYRGDGKRLEQVLCLLVEQALLFTKNQRLVVTAKEVEDKQSRSRVLLEFSVSPCDIFSPQNKADVLRSLAISLAALMGGEIGQDDTHPLTPTFWLRIPSAHVMLGITASAPSNQVIPEARASLSDASLADPRALSVNEKAVDVEQALIVLEDLIPMAEQNKFTAFRRFRDLQALTKDSALNDEVNTIGVLLESLRFEQALIPLRALLEKIQS